MSNIREILSKNLADYQLETSKVIGDYKKSILWGNLIDTLITSASQGNNEIYVYGYNTRIAIDALQSEGLSVHEVDHKTLRITF